MKSRNHYQKTSFDNDKENRLAYIYSPARRVFLNRPPESLSIGGRIRRERLLRKESLEDMSCFLGISPSYLGAMERGKRPVSRRMMDIFHEKLNLSYDFLLEGINVTGAAISQYVKEPDSYSVQHKIDVLLGVCDEMERESCYNLIHTFLTYNRRTRRDFSADNEQS